MKKVEKLETRDWIFTYNEKEAYLKNNVKSLREAYKKPSYKKIEAYNECKEQIIELCEKYNLKRDRFKEGISSYNLCYFTYQALLKGDKYNYIIRITASHAYYRKEQVKK